MKKYIGGFFELEIPVGNNNYHRGAVVLTNARACLSLFIKINKPKKIFVPNYTCDALIEPLVDNDIDFEFYNINKQLEIENYPKIEIDDYIIYINYFGLKGGYVRKIIEKYGNRLIIDNTHDFFLTSYEDNWSFTSARKYFGVPDGAYLYCGSNNYEYIEEQVDIKTDHLVNRLIGNQNIAYEQYKQAEKELNSKIKKISLLSEKILSTVDYDFVKMKRKSNFKHLSKKLQKYNSLQILEDKIGTPFCYPFLPEVNIEKEYFYRKNIFIPTYWEDALKRCEPGDATFLFSTQLLPFPVDHRYGEEEMEYIVAAVLDSGLVVPR